MMHDEVSNNPEAKMNVLTNVHGNKSKSCLR